MRTNNRSREAITFEFVVHHSANVGHFEKKLGNDYLEEFRDHHAGSRPLSWSENLKKKAHQTG
jgi:hypothetical protein